MTTLTYTVDLINSSSILKVVDALQQVGFTCSVEKQGPLKSIIHMTTDEKLTPDTILGIGALIGQVQMEHLMR